MSSLSELNKEIDQLESSLLLVVKEQVEIESLLEHKTKEVSFLREHLSKLIRALAILEGKESTSSTEEGYTVDPVESGKPESLPTPITPTIQRGRGGSPCNACGEIDTMFLTNRNIKGRYIRLMACTGERCGNEYPA